MSAPRVLLAYEGWLIRSRPQIRGAVLFSVLGPLLFLAAMGGGFGSLISTPEPIGGVPYSAFIAPGLLAASAMQTAVGESTWPVMGAVKWDRNYFAMLATPLTVADVFAGHLLVIATRITVTVMCFAGVAVWFDGIPLRMLLAIPAGALTGISIAAAVAAWAVAQESDSAFAALYRVGVMPLFVFSGAFFPTESLPQWLEALAMLSPVWHGVELSRGLVLGTLGLVAGAVHVLVLGGLLVAGLVWGRQRYAKVLTL